MEENVFTVEYILKNGLDKLAFGFIYITKCLVNDKKYIGQKMFRECWKSYLGSGKYYKNAEKLYGKDKFTRKIIAIAYSDKELNELEDKFINNYNAVEDENYYNLKPGGTASGYHHSDETKIKLSKANKGHETSIETRRKISNSIKGERNPNYGKAMSSDQKLKISKAHIGKINTIETRKKISMANKGRIISKITRDKISKIHKGKIVSKDTKQKLSDTLKKFSNKEVIEIRLKYNTGEYSQYDLAEQFFTSQSVINKIINCRGTYNIYPENKCPKKEYNKNLDKNKVVICTTISKKFSSIKEANIYCGLSLNNRDIGQVCRGKRNTAGKHLITGEPLKWMYYGEYIKPNPIPPLQTAI